MNDNKKWEKWAKDSEGVSFGGWCIAFGAVMIFIYLSAIFISKL